MTKGAKDTKLSFERDGVTVAIDRLLPLKILRSGVKSSKKYAQILGSIRAIGLVEAPMIAPVPKQPGRYFLLDGHLRIEALKDLGFAEVECLISTDDEAYTYNKRINRLAAVQEHRMITRAIQRGVPEEKIAAALGIDVTSVHRRSKMLNGICPEAVDILKDTPCPIAVFDIVRRMTAMRQIEVTELMVGQNNFTVMFARALLAATPEKQLVESGKKKPGGTTATSAEQIARMERELATLQTQVKSVEDTYGLDNLHLTVARGYIKMLLANNRVVRWLSNHRREYLAELQSIAEIEHVGAARTAAE
jgi:hypothetical protein